MNKCGTYNVFRNFLNSDQFNHVGMDRGRFLLEKDEVINMLLKCRSQGQYYVGLVPFIRNKCILFMDIDHLAVDQNIEDFMLICNDFLKTKYEENLLTNLITTSQTKNRFHIYYYDIVVNKQRLKMIWDEINEQFNNTPTPIDTSAISLRYDGFDRFDDNKRRYTHGTRYVPYKNAFRLDNDFYSKTYLLIDDEIPLTKFKSSGATNNLRRIHFPTSNLQQNYQRNVASLNLESNTSSSAINGITMNNLDNLNDSLNANDVQDKIQYCGPNMDDIMNTKYAFLKDHIKRGHELIKIIVWNQDKPSEVATFCLKKNKDARFCPFSGRFHHKNNAYYVWKQNEGQFKIKCHSLKCKNKFDVIYSIHDDLFTEMMIDEIGDENNSVNADGLYTDADLADEYVDWLDEHGNNIMYSTQCKAKNQDGTFFHFNKNTGIWEKDDGTWTLRRSITQNFRKWKKNQFNNEINQCKSDKTRKGKMKSKATVNQKLGDWNKLKGVVNLLKSVVLEHRPLDQNPFYLVCKNCVWDLHNNYEIIPDKDELITNRFCTSFNVEPEDQEALQYIHEECICKAHPDENEREVLLTYMSTGLNGIVIKKFLINHGMYDVVFFIIYIYIYIYI